MTPDRNAGIRLTLLDNGEGRHPAVFEAVANARQAVLLDTLMPVDDQIGRAPQQALAAASAAAHGAGARA